jgi:hypothetical protein
MPPQSNKLTTPLPLLAPDRIGTDESDHFRVKKNMPRIGGF